MDSHWIILFILSVTCMVEKVQCQMYRDNTPPIMWLDRNWRISNTEPVGNVVTRVHADDAENDQLEFGLEPLNYGANAVQNLPFRIDNTTGVVYLNDSLKDRVGENMFLYVTVSDGTLLAKNEVWVNIINGSSPSSSKQNRVRPPFLQLPSNLPGYRPPPSLPSNNLQERPPIEHPLGTSTPHITATSSPTKLHLQPVMNTTSPVTLSTQIIPDITIASTTTIRNILSTNMSMYPADMPVKSPPDLTMTLVPVFSVCAIFLTVGILAVIFRKRIYIGRVKNSKEEMAKESNGGIVLREDPTLAMQHWRSPRAISNRYEHWDREGSAPPSADDPQSTPAVTTDEWEFPRHRLKIFNILGEGAFGQVWKCEATDISGNEGVSVVAVKTLKENATEKERADLVSELQVMKMLEPHPNVVRLLGCCTEKEPIFVIMEYVSHGKLQSFLRNSRAERYYGNMHGKSKTLTSRDLTSFVYQVARGMDYLSSKGIIHRDLAARNILISEDHTCKVADFGFARDVATSHVYERKSEGRLPIRWMAPESLYDNIFSVKSDVWSFGVLIWEVVTLGSTPYPGLSAAEVMKKVRDGTRLDKPEHCRRELYNIMYYCWDKEPKERPLFSECVELLEKLLLTETDYIELERFPDHSYYNMVSLSGEKL